MRFFLLLCVLQCVMVSCRNQPPHELYQVSGTKNLLNSHFDGLITLEELRKHGDFGIGTFHALDGELIALNGKFYRLDDNGQALLADKKATLPSASIVHFKETGNFLMKDEMNWEAFQKYLEKQLPVTGYPLAIKIEAEFKEVLARTIARQKSPYPEASDVIKNQIIFSFKNQYGTLVGYKGNQSLGGLLVDGYHFHYISRDKKVGGHLLDAVIKKAKVSYMPIESAKLILDPLPPREGFSPDEAEQAFHRGAQ